MIVHFTQEEIAEQEALEAKYDDLLKALEAKIENLKPQPVPNTDILFAGIDPEKDPEKWEAALEKEDAALTAWQKSGSDEWRAAQDEHGRLIMELSKERNRLFEAAEMRQFSELNGDLLAIVTDFKNQVTALLEAIYESEQRQQARIANGGARQSVYAVSIGKYGWKLEPERTKRHIKAALHLHYEATKNLEAITKSFDSYIEDTIQQSPLVAKAGEGEPFGKIYAKPQEKTAGYRTRSKASLDSTRTIPTNLAVPSFQGYQYATSLYQNGNAYMQQLTSTDGLKFQDGKIFFEGRLQAISEAELQNMRTKEGIEKLDLALLRVFYSIILTAFEKTGHKEIKPVITLFVPELAECLGLQKNLNKKDIAGIIEKVQTFHNMVGILHETRNGKPTQSLYPVLNFEGYNDKKNTISFSSPYMNHVIQTVYDVAIRRDRKTGKPKLKTNGEPMRIASHSYLVKSEIAKERNKAAVENVFIITTLIEQAGDNLPRIRASTIVERNPQLQQRLEEHAKPALLLKRTFEKTWELLRDKTRLTEIYNDIQLPDPKNPATIPTPKTLNDLVFTFPHKGKNRE
jgi:hypothetical protein